MALRTSLAFAVAFGGIAAQAALTEEEKEQVLERHNLYRCMHDVPLMTWSDSVAETAQEWADNGVFEHSEGSGNGENLAYGQSSVVAATDAWYSEIELTDGGLVTEFGMGTGHYTQVVWSTSVELGCGKGEVTSANGAPYYVCQYSPPGNYMGQFEDKVKAPTVSQAVCTRGAVPAGNGAQAGASAWSALVLGLGASVASLAV